jgi:hypothetical protein
VEKELREAKSSLQKYKDEHPYHLIPDTVICEENNLPIGEMALKDIQHGESIRHIQADKYVV